METQEKNDANKTTGRARLWSDGELQSNRKGRVFGGAIIITIGVLLLISRMDIIIFPRWVFSWGMLWLVLGMYIGVRHSFRGPVWIVMTLIGVIFLIDRMDPELDFDDYIWPILIIGVGVILVFKSGKSNPDKFWKKWEDKYSSDQPQAHDDFIDSVTLFGGMKRNIISKNFVGGDLVTIFGGSELNLTQADTNGRIVLDLTQIFGGTKLIVPPHWRIQSEDLVSIFGGVDDKRPIQNEPVYDSGKILILKGTCIFGGIDIKSY